MCVEVIVCYISVVFLDTVYIRNLPNSTSSEVDFGQFRLT